MARMKIFNTLEQEAFEWPPVFNSVERKHFFSLPLPLADLMEELAHAHQQSLLPGGSGLLQGPP
ncbi:MAG: hypothetical protein WAW42_16660 [Candidatus Competibacteraceae bacterium]